MTDQTMSPTKLTIRLDLTEREADYLTQLLEEEGRDLPRRPSVLVSILRKLNQEPDARPSFFCKRCGWSENPANPWQVRSSDQAFHTPCPATPGDPGMADSPAF